MLKKQWYSLIHHYRHNACDKNLFSWLTCPGSFTKRLQQYTGKKVHITIIAQHIGIPTLSEQQYLGIKKKLYALVREVYLYSDNKPWLYARTVIPITHLTGKFSRLKNWGNVEIGKFLFANRAIKRSPFEIIRLSQDTDYYQQAVKALQQRPEILWARRSQFTLDHHALLLTEVFLSSFNN